MLAFFNAQLNNILSWYFGILDQFGLLGVAMLMVLESTIIPVPSEFVVPPAAVVYLKDVHQDAAIINTFMVILAGTLGSLLGSSFSYWVARALGRPLVVKYGKYVLISEHKLAIADRWMVEYGAWGIFFARLLPVIRHLISIPAGIVGMRFRTFAIMTTLGSFLWCTVLAIFGLVMSDDLRTMIAHKGHFPTAAEERAFEHAFHNMTLATLLLVGIAFIGYLLMTRRQMRVKASARTAQVLPDD